MYQSLHLTGLLSPEAWGFKDDAKAPIYVHACEPATLDACTCNIDPCFPLYINTKLFQGPEDDLGCWMMLSYSSTSTQIMLLRIR